MVGLISGLGGLRGFGENILGRNDDGSTDEIDITPIFEEGLDFFGNEFNSLFVNNNGSVTFVAPRSTFTPDVITAVSGNPEITPFFGDVDTRGGEDLPAGGTENPADLTPTLGGNSTGSNLVYYALDEANDRFIATWDDVGFFSDNTSKLNAFQLILTDRGEGNFDIEFRYEDINWTTGDASGGVDGLGGTVARAGWTAGTGNADEFFELPVSGNEAEILALEETLGNTGEAGRWFFNVRSGGVVEAQRPAPPNGAIAVSTGDPHFFTFDGAAYSFQAAGEFLLLDETDGSLQIQARQEPVVNGLSITTAVATIVDDQQIMIDARDEEPVQINGTPTPIEDFSSIEVGNGRIFREDNIFTVVYPGDDGEVNDGDERLLVELQGDRLDLELQIADDRAGGLVGLFGDADGDMSNDLATAEGEILAAPLEFDELYGDFRDSWLIDTVEESLFTYDEGESPASFFQPDFPEAFVTLDDLDPATRAEAEQAAISAGIEPGTANFNNAVLDFGFTGDNSFLESALNVPSIPQENIIAVNDQDLETVTVEDITQNESDTTFEFAVSTVPNLDTTLSFAVTGTGSNPTTPFDFAGGVNPSGLVEIVAGEGIVSLEIVDDAEIENDETFQLVIISEDSNEILATAIGTIADNDQERPTPVFGSLEDNALEAGIDFDGENDLVLVGAGEDEVFASIATGGNRIYGSSDNDEIFVSFEDRAFGGDGDDILDASQGRGENRIYGGAGDDDFFLGSDDRLIGNGGSDRFFVLAGGNNLITGGAGADQFWIANAELPASANDITDFTIGEDVLGIGGIDSIAEFSDLTITQDGDDAIISAGDDDLARLLGIDSNNLGADQFVIQESVEV